MAGPPSVDNLDIRMRDEAYIITRESALEALGGGFANRPAAVLVANAAMPGAEDSLVVYIAPALVASESVQLSAKAATASAEFYTQSVTPLQAVMVAAFLSEGYSTADSDSLGNIAGEALASRAAAIVADEVTNSPVDSTAQGETGTPQYDRRYYVTDHLGSVRVVFDENGDVIEARDYYALGLRISDRTYVSGSPAREGYTGHELDPETGDYYAGARYYLPELGRWLGVDAQAERGPEISPYAYSFNNPLSFFDPDGEWPYTFYVRSFHPSASFAGGFHGDNRGFSTSLDVSSRVQQQFTLDTEQRSLSGERTWSDFSYHPALGFDVGEPSGTFSSVRWQANSLGNEMLGVSTSYSGSNPLAPGSPAIDVNSHFSVTENLERGLLFISAIIGGDNFPATEAFVADANGNSVFLGVSAYEGSPFTSLWGENDRSITSVDLQIRIDSDGIFQSVLYGDQEYSLDNWNEFVGSANPRGN